MNIKHAYYRAFQKTMKLSVNFLDWTPPQLLKGAGSVKELPKLVKEQGLDNVLVVTDKGLMGLHLLDSLFEGLEAEGIKYSVFDGVQPNPTIYNIEDALKIYKDNNCEGFSLCYEDREGVAGLNRFFKESLERLATRQRLTLTLRLSPLELTQLLSDQSNYPSLRDNFRFNILGESSLYRLESLHSYDPESRSAKCTFIRLTKD